MDNSLTVNWNVWASHIVQDLQVSAGISWRENLETAPVTSMNSLALVLILCAQQLGVFLWWLRGLRNAFLCWELNLIARVHW